MGQIFHSCVYDIETRTCCVYDADKFHANCYAHSGSVFSVHFLLRQKPYRVMWGGYYVDTDKIKEISDIEYLLGISTYNDFDKSEIENNEPLDDSCYKKIKFINENRKLWKKIDIWDEAKKFFDWENTHSVNYSGYLINHTKNLAVDLADYYKHSKFLTQRGELTAIDLIPVLTETGGGAQMAFIDGVSIDSTEELAGKWCGDLLKIVDEIPSHFQLINCRFSDLWEKAYYCYYTFGTDKEDFVLQDKSGKRLCFVGLTVFGKRGIPCHVKAFLKEDKIRFETEKVPGATISN